MDLTAGTGLPLRNLLSWLSEAEDWPGPGESKPYQAAKDASSEWIWRCRCFWVGFQRSEPRTTMFAFWDHNYIWTKMGKPKGSLQVGFGQLRKFQKTGCQESKAHDFLPQRHTLPARSRMANQTSEFVLLDHLGCLQPFSPIPVSEGPKKNRTLWSFSGLPQTKTLRSTSMDSDVSG